MDKNIEKAKEVIDRVGFLVARTELAKVFGKKNVDSLPFGGPGFMVNVGGKKIAILSASKVDGPDATSDDGKIAIGYI